MMIEIYLLLLVVIILLWLYFEAPFILIKRRIKIIPGPKPLPIIGNLISIKREKKGPLEYFIKCTNKYGPVFKVHLPRRISIFLTDPQDVEVVLKNSELIEKSSIIIKYVKPWLGNGLLTSAGSFWKEHRKLITPAFHFNILEKYFDVFNKQTDTLIDILSNKVNQDLDIFPILQLFALDVICETAMGIKIHAQTKLVRNDYVTAVQEMEKIISSRNVSFILSIPFLFPFTSTGRKQKKMLNIIKSYSDRIIKTRKRELVRNSITTLNIENSQESRSKNKIAFLDLLLQATHSDGTPLTEKEISDEVDTFLFGGHDTTSTQMSFLLYLLSRHPDIQEALYKEQYEIFNKEKRSPTYQEIQNMHYLERTIKESQRLLGSIPLISRQVTQDLLLKTNGYVVPKGSVVTIFVHQLHRNPSIYPNPDKFDPNRFLPENVRKRNSFAFIPFGAGSRNCIGQKFALLEMKACISKIIRHFKILPATNADGKLFEPELQSTILLASSNGIYVHLVPRT